MGTVPLGPKTAAPREGEEVPEFGGHTFIAATGNQRQEDHEQPGKGELAAAGEVLRAFLGDGRHEVGEEGEQPLIKFDRGHRFFGGMVCILL